MSAECPAVRAWASARVKAVRQSRSRSRSAEVTTCRQSVEDRTGALPGTVEQAANESAMSGVKNLIVIASVAKQSSEATGLPRHCGPRNDG